MAEMKARPAQRSADEYMAGAMSMEATNFLPYFREKHPKLCASYESLAAKGGMKEEFEGNPLIFILSNEPRCCVHVAREFVDMMEAEQPKEAEEEEKPVIT